ncbi:MAG: hypothetical protein M1830_004509, partial [Pleopsidium flavum]
MTRVTERQSSAQDNEQLRRPDSTSVSHTNTPTLSAKDLESASDNDTGERPVREKLKKTSIATLPKYGVTAASADHPADDDHSMATETTVTQGNRDAENDDRNTRGRPTRKRSLDDLEATDQTAEEDKAIAKSRMEEKHEGHARKRSRDIRNDNASRENGRRKTSREKALLEEEANEGQEDKSMSESDEHVKRDQHVATPPDQLEFMEEDVGRGVLSPRKKRSRDQVEQDQDKKQKVAATEEERARRNSEEEEKVIARHIHQTTQIRAEGPEKKRPRDTSEEGGEKEQDDRSTTEIAPTSGFANTSVVSPFGALAGTKSHPGPPPGFASEASVTEPHTSSSAFAPSGFTALSNTATSPFGTLGTSSTTLGASSFGTLGTSNKLTASAVGAPSANKITPSTNNAFGESAASASSGFGSTVPSTFGTSSTSAFGNLSGSTFGSGFGGGFGGAGGGLKTFAAPNGPGVIGTGGPASRAFGSPAGDDEDVVADDEDGQRSGDARYGEAQDHEDKRFHEQEVETGEEGESTIFSCKAKLYHFTEKEWKERGIGTFKLNVVEVEESQKKTARLIMRTVGVFRVVLNTPVFKDMKIGDLAGKEPTGKMINLAGVENGKPVPLMLKVRPPSPR